MTPIQSSKTVFFDNSGNVLENGYIYIGQPSTNPQVSGNQKTVTFEDSSGYQFTASQPLRTIAGRIVYNGRPITALVDGVHSMLILNSANVQIEYTASITPSDTAGTVDLSDTIRVGLTLDAVKAFDVAVGDVVRSVGSATATDGLGADWLTISATGGAGDDVDLIDFDNGLQGQRDVSKLYQDSVLPYVTGKTFNPDSPAEVWSGSSTSVNVTALSDNGPGFYIILTSTGRQFFFVSAYDLDSITSHITGAGQNNINIGPSVFLITSTYAMVFYSGGTKTVNVYEFSYEINNSGTVLTNRTSSNLTITNIFKV